MLRAYIQFSKYMDFGVRFTLKKVELSHKKKGGGRAATATLLVGTPGHF